MIRTRRPRLYIALLTISLVCSAGSLVSLVVYPEGTGSLRTSLNLTALLLVIVTTTLLSRGSGKGDV
jgi:hypothetical protein